MWPNAQNQPMQRGFTSLCHHAPVQAFKHEAHVNPPDAETGAGTNEATEAIGAGTAERSEAPGTPRTETGAPRMLVVGAGIAGLTTALRLAECNYRVTVVERKEMLGGNLASRTTETGACLDVYPHMYQPWYKNFWALMESVEANLEESFKAFSSVGQAQRLVDGKPQFASLTRPYSAAHLVENLFSGVAPPADMFLFGYASLDLMAEIRNPTLKLENVSLTGYLSSRVYMTQTALDAYEAFVLRVWGIPAYMISAADCQTYAGYCYATADEDGYLCTGPADENVIKPIREKLESFLMTDGKPAVEILSGWEVTRVALEALPLPTGGHRVNEVELAKLPPPARQTPPPPPPPAQPQSFVGRAAYDTGEPTGLNFMVSPEVPEPTAGVEGTGDRTTRADFDSVVLAVPPSALSTLARRRTMDESPRIVDAIPELAELHRVGSAPIPVIHLYLKGKIAELPENPVALNGSNLSLAFTDLSQNWKRFEKEKGSVLALSCSEALPLVGPHWWNDGFAMIKELSEYLPFEPGKKWNDGGDVNWERTTYDANADAQLSLNSVGSDRWRPETSYPKRVENLFFAGDYCKHNYGITTIEGAVATGVNAAAAVQEHRKTLGAPIKRSEIELLPPEVFVGMRYTWLATALAAMGWSKLTTPTEVAERAKKAETEVGSEPFELLAKSATLRYLLTPGLPARPAPARGGGPPPQGPPPQGPSNGA
jgi:hypothetical protein